MSLKRYRLFTAITMVIVAASVAWAVVNSNAWIPAPVTVAAIVIGIILRKRVRELAVDERVNTIAEKALAFASGVFLIVAAPIGLTLVALGWESSSDLYVIGLTITFTVCGLVLFYYAANLYYNRKHSGKK
jgi:uncharacterized membrane protein